MIVEPQQAPVHDKLEDWPRYAAALWLDIAKPVTVLVICADDQTARWYDQRHTVQTCLVGYSLPLVIIGPRQVPLLTDPAEMAASPALAVLSFAAHGKDNPAVVDAFHAELTTLPQRQMQKYYEFAHNISDFTLRNILEKLVASDMLLTSPIAIENHAKGLAEGEAESVLLVLEARGLTATEAQRAKIMSCTDLPQLRKWITSAVTTVSVDDLFA